jgi:hypothetical protein
MSLQSVLRHYSHVRIFKLDEGSSFSRAVGQAVIRWLPTAAAQVRVRAERVRFVGCVCQVFSEYFGFPCQSPFHQFLHNHPHVSSGAGITGQ